MTSQLKAWTVWHRGSYVADATEYRSPDLGITTGEYFAGHMDGPRIIDNGMTPLVASLRIRGANVNDFIAIGFRPFLSTRFVVREGYVGNGEGLGIEDELDGFITRVTQEPLSENGRAGKSTIIEIALRYYRRAVGSAEKVLLIPGEGVRRINGIDSLSLVSAMVYLSSLPDGLEGIDIKSLALSDFLGEGF